MAIRLPFNAFQALHNVFRPAFRTHAGPLLQPCPVPRTQPLRSLHQTPQLRETDGHKFDQQIKARMVYLVDETTGKLSEQPVTRYDIMRRMDSTTHRLEQLTPDPNPASPNYQEQLRNFIPVCRIVSKKALYAKEKELKKKKAEEKKLVGKANTQKTLELNWGIDPNDLSYRLNKMEKFLEEGRKVEIVLAAKKRGKKATPDECEALMRKIRDTVAKVEGSKEVSPLEGKVGAFATWMFQGPPPKLSAVRAEKQGNGEEGG
jgi:translation initiation factor IF-3